jgi:hypothetical protein
MEMEDDHGGCVDEDLEGGGGGLFKGTALIFIWRY